MTLTYHKLHMFLRNPPLFHQHSLHHQCNGLIINKTAFQESEIKCIESNFNVNNFFEMSIKWNIVTWTGVTLTPKLSRTLRASPTLTTSRNTTVWKLSITGIPCPAFAYTWSTRVWQPMTSYTTATFTKAPRSVTSVRSVTAATIWVRHTRSYWCGSRNIISRY